MNKSSNEINRKRLIGFLWVALVCFFNTVPLFIISILANLDTVRLSYLMKQTLRHSLTSACVSLDQRLRPFPGNMGHRLSRLLRGRFWCVTTSCIRPLRILLAYHHEVLESGKRCLFSLLSHDMPYRRVPLPIIIGGYG